MAAEDFIHIGGIHGKTDIAEGGQRMAEGKHDVPPAIGDRAGGNHLQVAIHHPGGDRRTRL